VFETIVPRSVRLSEAPSYGLPIALYRPESKGADAYALLAAELRTRDGRPLPAKPVENLPADDPSAVETATNVVAADGGSR
jgi:hypothetical protein